MSSVELTDVRLAHGDHTVLHALDLRVDTAERIVVLGASGAGKSTLLRAIAGVHPVAAGRIRIGDRDVTRVPPRDRGVAMVDQDATLQPHLDVQDNVGFPLRIRHVGEQERAHRVQEQARTFGFLGRLRRPPRTLSAGERDDVARARALIRGVGVLVLDEPFAHHDAPRVSELVRELRRLQEAHGVTLIAASNDQRIAMALADRCVVLDAGTIVQQDAPMALFARPATTFVAGFVGTPAMNLLDGHIERARTGARIVAGPLRIRSFAPAVTGSLGVSVTVGIRPTDLHRPADTTGPGSRAADRATGSPAVAGATHHRLEVEEVVRQTAFLGDRVEVALGDPRQPLRAVIEPPAPPIGALLRLEAAPRDVHVFDAAGVAIVHGV